MELKFVRGVPVMRPLDKNPPIVMYYQIVRGLYSKTPDSSLLFSVVICLTETWLQDGVYDCELFPPQYKVFRYKRDHVTTGISTGCGILLAVLIGICAEKVDLSPIACRNMYGPHYFIVILLYVPS